MKRAFCLIVGATLSLVVMGSSANGEVVRPGDRISIRLAVPFNALTAHTGDGLRVSVPDGLRADPNGPPEIPPATEGNVTFRLLEKSATSIKYNISSLLFKAKTGQVEIKTALADPETGTLKIQKASTMKKLLLPPIFGFLIWKDKAVLPEGKELNIEITEQKRW